MKVEDLYYPPANEAKTIEMWLKENPVDYFKAVFLLNHFENIDESFKYLYLLSRNRIPNVLYKYVSLSDDENLNQKKLNVLMNKKIYLSEIEKFNDPFDTKAFYYNKSAVGEYAEVLKNDKQFTADFYKHIYATSFTSNGVNSMPMWAHYSNNHHGYCVSYELGENKNENLYAYVFPVQYTDDRLDVTSWVKKYIEKNKEVFSEAGLKEFTTKDHFLTAMALLLCNIKHTSWNYEKEYRFTVNKNVYKDKFIYAEAKEIYVGMNCSKGNAQKLLEIGKSQNIPVYHMFFDEAKSDFNLSYKKIDNLMV